MSAHKKILNQISSWYKTILQVGLFIGFLLTSYYFLSIGYFPANDLTSFVTILLYEALLCFFALGSLFFVLFVAPYFWIKTVLGAVKTCDWIVGRDSLEMICNIANKEETKDKIISKYVYIRIFSIYGSITLSYVSILSYCYWYKNFISLYILIFTGIICFNISCLIFPSFLDKKYIDNLSQKIESQRKLKQTSFWNFKLNFINLIFTVIASIVSGSCLFIGIMFVYFLISPIEGIFKFLLPILVIGLSGMCLIINERYHNLKTSIFVSAMAIIIAFIPLSIDNIEANNMRKSTLGSFDAILEIDTIACNILSQQGFDIACDKQKPPISANNIHVLWRGSEYYLRFEDKAKKIHYLIIPSNHIYGLTFKNNNDKDEKKS